MNLKLIACNVFLREASLCIARSPHVIDVEYVELGEHAQPDTLRASLQKRIDAADRASRPYDAVLLLYGLCGNSAIGLSARQTRLVMPRAHDCCTLLLGSREAFKEHFGDNPSTPFSCAGYFERGDYYLRVEDGENKVIIGDAYAEYVRQYGEENAKYIWESMHPELHSDAPAKAVFIDLPETAALGYCEKFRVQAEADGKQFVRLEGNLRLIASLVNGDWSPAEFLLLEPGQRIAGVYDWTEVIKAVTPATPP